MLQAVKVRLYPTEQQKLELTKNFGAVRKVWNYYLDKSNKDYLETKKGFKYNDAAKDLTQLKRTSEYQWLSEADSQALQQSLKNLEKAFKNFFEGRAKFPNFKSRFHKQAIAYPQRVTVTKNNCVKLPKIGGIVAKITRPIEGKIKTVTVSKTSTDKYFASILIEVPDINLENISNLKMSGIDVGCIDVAAVFDGESSWKVANPRHFNRIKRNLRRKQQQLASKEKGEAAARSPNHFGENGGSHKRAKAKKKVASVYEYLTNARADFYHKLSRKLVDENQVLVFENLNVKGLKRTNLAKSLADACIGMLVNFCQYKLEKVGGKLIEIDRFFPSSQICSHCGYRDGKKPLSIREWTCSNCGTHHDRDENAAKNIREEGLRILTAGTTVTALGDSVRPSRSNSIRHGSVRRESHFTATQGA
jgi:putative transposase